MEQDRNYTEKELVKKLKEIETEIKFIFSKDYIPYFLVKKANILYNKWKKITNWEESNIILTKEQINEV